MSALGLLILSIVALAIGPLGALLVRGTKRSHDILDGLVLVSVSGLVLLHVLPHVVDSVGWIAVAVAGAGFAMPFAVERWSGGSDSGRSALFPLVVASFGVHALVDGSALAGRGAATQARLVALAVVLHRLPDGLAIWSLVSVARGAAVAARVLAAVAGFTALGFGVGGRILDGTSGRWVAFLQAFVAGSVLHIVMHGSRTGETGGRARATAHVVGAVLGLGLLVVLAVEARGAALITGAAVGLMCWRGRSRARA